MDKIRKVAFVLTGFCMMNGIHVEDKNGEFIGTSILRVSVERRSRTNEEIDMLIRQLKVLFILISPIQDIRIRYRVVE